MPAILTHKAIMLLARERVADMRNRLLRKKASAAPLTDLEFRILRLATLTHVLLSDANDAPATAPDTPADPGWPVGFGAGASRFAVMGSMGPDIPGLAAIAAPAQAVWFDMVHKGTPDPNREQVNARSTDMTLELYRKASVALTERPTGDVAAKRAYVRDLDRIRAYVLGHLTHIAGDALAHPFIADVEWHVPSRDSDNTKFGHAHVEGSLDSRVAVAFYNREGPRKGQPWSAWWPTVDEVPPELFTGYSRALDGIYKSLIDRPDGLRAFEDEVRKFTVPAPDPGFFRDGYRTMHNAGVELLYHWGYGSWLGFLSVVMVPIIATMPLTFALTRGHKVFEQSLGDAGERAAFEVFSLPLSMNALTPLVFGIFAAGKTWRGVEGELSAGLIGSALSTVAAALAIPFSFVEPDPGAEWRWALLFAAPAAFGLVMTTTWLVKALQGESRRKIVPLIFALPFLIAAIMGVLLLIFAELIGSESEEAGAITWGVVAALLGVALIVLLFWLPVKARDAKLPEHPDAFPALRPHHVRLFDRSALFDLPGQHDPAATEAHFPTGLRPLLRLWWTGAGDLFVRPRRTHLEFGRTESDPLPTVVSAPIVPVTLRQLAEFLPVAAANAGLPGLHCALVHEADANVPLPPGATFADLGDIKESRDEDAPEADLTSASVKLIKLSAENTDKSFTLQHPPKRAQAVRFDRFGPVPFDERELDAVRGAGKVTGDGTRMTGEDTAFRFFFQAGDRMVVNGSTRVVTKVESDTVVIVSSPFSPAPRNLQYERLGHEQEVTRGYTFVATPHAIGADGDSIMDLAGDLGALMCLGGTSHMLDGTESSIADLTGMVDSGGTAIASTTLGKVSRVFRNWSLDRRLVDEWREIVTGGAMVDATAAADPGQSTLMQQGWIPTLRKWLRVVDDQAVGAADGAARSAGPNEPTNLALSQAMAHLLSMPAPVVVRRP